MSTIPRAAVAAVLLTLLLGAPAASAHHYAPIQPGSMIADLCTTNFVFTNSSGDVFIGTAAHCVKPGQRVLAPGLGEFGTVVYYRGPEPSSSEQQNDFALIRIDDDFVDNVSAKARYWGGPTGVQDSFTHGDPTYHYGQGVYFNRQEATRHRTGVLEYLEEGGPYDGWYLATHPLYGGDSGGGLLGPDGAALGVVAAVAPTYGRPGYVFGPTFDLIMRELQADGWDLELVIADFPDPASVSEVLRKADIEKAHCDATPRATLRDPDGCTRASNFGYRQLSVSANATKFSLPPWILMATPDASPCDPTLQLVTNWVWDWCEEYVIILDGDGLTWPTSDDGLVVGVTWDAPASSIEMRVFDENGRQVGVTRTATASSTEVLIPEAEPGYYRVVIQPTHSAYTGQERGFRGYAYLTVPQTNETAAAQASEERLAETGADAPAAGVPLAAAALATALAFRRRTRRP